MLFTVVARQGEGAIGTKRTYGDRLASADIPGCPRAVRSQHRFQLLLSFEDAQWADATSLVLLDLTVDSSARRPTAAQNGSLGSSFWPMANPPLVFARTWHELLPIVADDPSSRGQRGRRPHRARYLARNRCRRSRVTSQNQSCQHFALLHHRLMDLILWALLIGQGSDNKRTANH